MLPRAVVASLRQGSCRVHGFFPKAQRLWDEHKSAEDRMGGLSMNLVITTSQRPFFKLLLRVTCCGIFFIVHNDIVKHKLLSPNYGGGNRRSERFWFFQSDKKKEVRDLVLSLGKVKLEALNKSKRNHPQQKLKPHAKYLWGLSWWGWS